MENNDLEDCMKCGGKGFVYGIDTPGLLNRKCPHCLGKKRLNWIENVFGKNEQYNDIDLPEGYILCDVWGLPRDKYPDLYDSLKTWVV